MTRFCGLLTAIALGIVLLSTPAASQMQLLTKSKTGSEESGSVTTSVENLVEQAKKDGLTVVVISPTDEAATAPAMTDMDITGVGVRMRDEIRRLAITVPQLPSRLALTFEAIGRTGNPYWLPIAVATALAGILLGYFVRRAIGIWGREYFRYMYNPEPRDNAERIGYLLFRVGLQTAYTVIMFVAAMLVAIIFDSQHEPSRATILVIVGGYCTWRLLREVVAFNLLAPDAPTHRMLNLSDEDARSIFTDMQRMFALAITVLGASTWMGRLGLDADAKKLLLILASVIAALVIGYVTIKHRRAVAGAILGAGPVAEKSLWRRAIARSWHVIGLVYLVAATAVSIGRLLLGLPAANILISAPAAAVIVGIGVYGVIYLLIEFFYRTRQAAHDRRMRALIQAEIEKRRQEAAARREAESEPIAGEEEIENPEAEGDHLKHFPPYKPLFKPLLHQAAGVLVTLGALAFILGIWNVRAGDRGNPITAFMDTLVVILIAWMAYRAINIFVGAKLEEEGESSTSPDMLEEEPGGHGSSRLGTLLPIIRLAGVTTIVAVAGMIVLSNLGVDVAPLFAGAGVVGLAVGFGAQTLIRDIFSGGFFLFDDAFRKGEYIELGNIRGTVEKISLRSFQLRHHNGPLHTIPFGEITQLTNYSRDWVIMKLPLRVPFDTDIEKVRKLIKKLGQELLDHPDVGKNFLQPLKSQGVVQVDEAAMIMRVKFMTKPGDQWVTRKVVYAAIQELFQREGIHLANREVTVRIADRVDRPLTEAEKEAAAAAAGRLLADQSNARPAPSGDDR